MIYNEMCSIKDYTVATLYMTTYAHRNEWKNLIICMHELSFVEEVSDALHSLSWVIRHCYRKVTKQTSIKL